jgi:hypothetical protein
MGVGKRVRVTDGAGATVQGRVVQVGPSWIDLGPAGRFDAASVQSIDVSDPLWNGAILGYLTGAVAAGALVMYTCLECTFKEQGVSKEQGVMGYSLMAIGAAVGAEIDRNLRRHAYRRMEQLISPRVEWRPVAGNNRRGVQVSLRF